MEQCTEIYSSELKLKLHYGAQVVISNWPDIHSPKNKSYIYCNGIISFNFSLKKFDNETLNDFSGSVFRILPVLKYD